MKRKCFSLCLLLAAVITFFSCRRENGKTHYHIETDAYSLTVDGQRLSTDEQVVSFPFDTCCPYPSDDTIRINNNVWDVALTLNQLAKDYCFFSEPYKAKGIYVLQLELINKQGSDHQANASAALANLREWGYIDIDTIRWRNITIVKKGDIPGNYGDKTWDVAASPYKISIPQQLLSDSVESTTLGKWIENWLDCRFCTDDELFSLLATHEYDTIHTTPVTLQVYPTVRRNYKDKNEILGFHF